MNFMIEFKVLVMKANTNELHTIFLLKKNIQADIIKDNTGISTNSNTRNIQELEGGNYLSRTRFQVHERMTRI